MDPEEIITFWTELSRNEILNNVLLYVKIISGTYCLACFLGMFVISKKRKDLDLDVSEREEEKKKLESKVLPVTLFQERWNNIKNLLNSDNESDYRAAVIDADNLLDIALQEIGLKEGNVGDRLKKMDTSKISNLDILWQARRLRNSYVHDTNFRPNMQDIINAIEAYRVTLNELGANLE